MLEQQQELVRTMFPHVRLPIILSVLAVGACGASDRQRSVRLLDHRLETQLAPDIEAHRAVVERMQDGARVTLFETSLFPNDAATLDNRGVESRVGVVQGLLDPDLMRVQLADTSALPEGQRDARIRNVVQYFTAYGLARTLRPAETVQAEAPGPAGLSITISVVCPDRHDGAGYDSGALKPGCF